MNAWTETFCGSTMCFATTNADEQPRVPKVYLAPAVFLEPSTFRSTAIDGGDDDGEYDDDDVRIGGSPTKVPPVIRINLMNTSCPITPTRDCDSSERDSSPLTPRKNVLRLDRERRLCPPMQTTRHPHVRPLWVSYRPMSPSQVLKRAHPMDMKDYYERSTDDGTVATQDSTHFTTSVSYVSSGAESGEEEKEEQVRVLWRKSGSGSFDEAAQPHDEGTNITTTKTNWNESKVEEESRIIEPPELVRFHVNDKEEEWVLQTPHQNALRCKVATSCFYGSEANRPRTRSYHSAPYLPEMDDDTDLIEPSSGCE